MTWILVVIAVIFAIGIALSMLRKSVPRPVPQLPVSFLGIREFQDAPGGVTFNDVWPPDSPADKAGLVGGDIITAFDNHATVDEDEMMRLLATTPEGKTVEVVYLRDGQPKRTSLTTTSELELQRLEGAFINRGTNAGQLGFQDATVAPVPGRNINGVLLESLYPNGPAATAGLAVGDFIIAFDGVPIRTVGELVLRARRAIPYSTVKVTIVRGTEQLEIPVKMGKRG